MVASVAAMASEPSSRASGTGGIVFAALVGATLLGATFAGDGSDVGGIVPVGGAAVVLVAASLVAVAFRRLPALQAGRAGAVLVWALVLLVAWTGATVWWSIVADRSWDAFNKGLVYVAFLALGIVLAAVGRERAARLAASLLACVIGVTLVWALTTKAVPAAGAGQYAAMGVEAADQRIIVSKAVYSTRDGYPMGQDFIPVDTPGLAASNLSRFRYLHRRVPMLPWEPDATYDPQP